MIDKFIIKLLEEKCGYPLNSSSDCERMALDIETNTGDHLGFTTLKRLLGFTSERATPRQSTLEILARFLGFNSYKELEDSINNKGDSDFDCNPESILSSRLPADTEINISYYPNRRLNLQHIKDDKFIVTESINGSLLKGDKIFVDSFTSGLPMIAKDVIRNGESLGRYVAGEKFGINLEI
ncbi:MAG: hypothetical protein J1F16_08045 [Muribaculaceae bacterium]|nr:hypothetical protein [Muribaculaceae bacterium]